MRFALLALFAISCAPIQRGPSVADPGYIVEVTNHHPDDVVVYLEPSGRRLGRLLAHTGKQKFWLSSGQVQTRPYIVACVGNRSPTNRQCFTTHPMTGGYGPHMGEPGTVFLVIQHGIGGIVALLNG